MNRLGEIKQLIQKRYEERRQRPVSPAIADKYDDPFQKVIYGVLADLGIDFPIDFFQKPPDIPGVARQGIFKLAPGEAKTFTFQSRKKGFLIIDFLDFVFEDPIANEDVRIAYNFDDTVNTPNYQIDKGVAEAGHWKFDQIVLYNEDSLTITVTNTNLFAQAVCSIASEMWML